MFGKGLGTAYPCWHARCHGNFLSCHHTSLCVQLKQSLLNPAGSWKTIIKIFFPLSTHAIRAKGTHRETLAPLSPCACLRAPPLAGIVLYFTHPPLHLFYISFSLSCIYPSQKSFLALISKNSSMPFCQCLPAFQGYSFPGTSVHPFLCLAWSCPNLTTQDETHTPIQLIPFCCCCCAWVPAMSKFLEGFGATIRLHNEVTLSHKPTDVILWVAEVPVL